MSRVYVGGLSPSFTMDDLKEQFKPFGKAITFWIARNPSGFAFVTMESQQEAEAAVSKLNGMEVGDSKLKVEFSKEDEKKALARTKGFTEPRHEPRHDIRHEVRHEPRDLRHDLRPGVTKCYNCNQLGHYAADCAKPRNEGSCYSCGEYGHKLSQCPRKEDWPLQEEYPRRLPLERDYREYRPEKEERLYERPDPRYEREDDRYYGYGREEDYGRYEKERYGRYEREDEGERLRALPPHEYDRGASYDRYGRGDLYRERRRRSRSPGLYRSSRSLSPGSYGSSYSSYDRELDRRGPLVHPADRPRSPYHGAVRERPERLEREKQRFAEERRAREPRRPSVSPPRDFEREEHRPEFTEAAEGREELHYSPGAAEAASHAYAEEQELASRPVESIPEETE